MSPEERLTAIMLLYTEMKGIIADKGISDRLKYDLVFHENASGRIKELLPDFLHVSPDASYGDRSLKILRDRTDGLARALAEARGRSGKFLLNEKLLLEARSAAIRDLGISEIVQLENLTKEEQHGP